ncbi:MAG: hypothetical protein D6675_00845 [Gemmatimonadetes bacterium]|nr:MAG: hypothetical protein D6675_00845 [Gemmatimonadota bacterium]
MKGTNIFFWAILLSALSHAVSFAEIRIIEANSNRLLIDYRPETVTFQEQFIEGTRYHVPFFTEGELSAVYGEPQLPAQRINVAIPPNSDVTVQIVDIQTHQRTGIRIPPAGANPIEPNPAIYQTDHLFPAQWLTSAVSVFRQQHFAKILLFPVRYHPMTERAVLLDRMTFEIRFQGADRMESHVTKSDPAYEAVYRSMFLNYEQGKAWRTLPPTPLRQNDDPFSEGVEWFKIHITKTGMIKLTYDLLDAAGVPVNSLVPQTLRIYYGGGRVLPEDLLATPPEFQQIPVRVIGDADNSFDPGDALIFWGEAVDGFAVNPQRELEHYDHRYANENAYWLTYGVTDQRLQMDERLTTEPVQFTDITATPMVRHWEENAEFLPQLWGREHLWWAWHYIPQRLRGGEGVPDTSYFTLDINHPDPAQVATLNLKMYGMRDRKVSTSVTHHIFVYLNDALLGEREWVTTGSGYSGVLSTMPNPEFPIPAGVLRDGANQLRIVHPHDIVPQSNPDNQYIDYFQLYYNQQLRARDNQLHFWSPADVTGAVRYRLSGWDTDEVDIYEIRSAFEVVKVLPNVNSGGIIEFYADNDQPYDKQYLLLTPDQYHIPTIEAVERVSLANLRQEPTGAGETSYLIISYPDFVGNVQPLVENCLADKYSVVLATLDDVYNEFSWGLPDVTAIRNFVRYAYDHWENRPPEYVLLVGDGDYDFRGFTGQDQAEMPPYYENDEFDLEDIVPVDDWFVSVSGDDPDLAIGRIPASSRGEVDIIVDKIVQYRRNPEYGLWRNTIIMAADDESEKEEEDPIGLRHVQDTEKMVANPSDQIRVVPYLLDKQKIYMTEYNLAPGGTKPDASAALIEAWNAGGLVVNWIGHGNYEVWAHERLFHGSDVTKLRNGYRLPVMSSFSCDVGRFDGQDCMAEKLLRASQGGAVGCVASARLATSNANYQLNKNFYAALFSEVREVGKALLTGKENTGGNDRNKKRYMYFGDPSMPLGMVRSFISLHDLAGRTFAKGDTVVLRGTINDFSNFDGTVSILVRDTAIEKEYANIHNQSRTVTYTLPGQRIYQGDVEVINGEFEAPFIVPMNARSGELGRITVYAWDEVNRLEAAGYADSVHFAGFNPHTPADTTGPDVVLYYQGRPLGPGEALPAGATLAAVLSDIHGINMTGEEGRQIALRFDDQGWIDVSSDFRYDLNSFQQGTVSFTLDPTLEEGRHQLMFRVSDNFGNVTETHFDIRVSADVALDVSHVYNYPNPFEDETQFVGLLHSNEVLNTEILIQIFTVAGRKIREIHTTYRADEFPTWDGRDDDGDEVANGTYIYKFIVTTSGGEQVEKIGKAVVLR